MRFPDPAGGPLPSRPFPAAPSPFAADDGTAPPAFLAAHAAFAAGRSGPEEVLAVLQDTRLLVPLLTEPGVRGEHGAELALVTVAGPDGRRVLPAFSSTAALGAWNPSARPVPAPARQVALGAAADGTELVIVDPGSPTCFGLRRSALEALAAGAAWVPPWLDPVVREALAGPVRPEPAVVDITIGTDDPGSLLEGAEVGVTLVVRPVLDRDGLAALVDRIRSAWLADGVVTARVDSLAVRVTAP